MINQEKPGIGKSEKKESEYLGGEFREKTFAKEDGVGEHELAEVFLHTIHQ